MKILDAYEKLRKLNQATIQTRDAAAALKVSTSAASKILSRIVMSNQMIKLKPALYGFKDRLDALALPECLSAPFPSYVSLQTALYFHGMISQIPNSIYAVTLARTRFYQTSLSDVSLHHVNPEFFCGYVHDIKTGVKMASAEKALIDYFYFYPAKSNLFKKLPELELPGNFSFDKAIEYTNKINFINRRTIVIHQLNSIIELQNSQ